MKKKLVLVKVPLFCPRPSWSKPRSSWNLREDIECEREIKTIDLCIDRVFFAFCVGNKIERCLKKLVFRQK